ncbi:uncharacterized protein KY384_004236 [Bacidia gigantensis]|uniref:uncharacterized protein n=1 Tax=Bacidia gigantensis TaxID=2732470 RepID=UPI001D05B277|nr:uncharacterized protein KY384_004236 [Bacidia gigantensis]KAG8530879.1 hypothetical protein KY384_004236 [Bacidia gigantensis]
MALTKYDWILAIISIAFCCSAFGNGANDVANSYASSVAARTLSMKQVGFLSAITEFVGAVALGSRVTSTIKNGIIKISRFEGNPGALILAMSCAEVGSASWLLIATKVGFPVSTTQTIVGALIGVGFASETPIKWAWDDGSVSQIAASWAVAPGIAGCFAALLFGTVKYSVLERKDSLKWAMRLIPAYLAFTASMLALFIVVEAPTAPSLEEFGAGKATGIILGVFFGSLAIAYGFFLPYFHRRLIKEDSRLKWWHIPLGPSLWSDDPYIYLPSKDTEIVTDHYKGATEINDASSLDSPAIEAKDSDNKSADTSALEQGENGRTKGLRQRRKQPDREPEEKYLDPVAHLQLLHPSRMWGTMKYILLQGVTRDCITFGSANLKAKHALTIRYDNRVEHLWTYAQVASAMLMSIAHGSNDVSNAVGPWSAAYSTYKANAVDSESAAPRWILAIAGFLLGAGFWFFGYHIIRSIGNRITQLSPTRGVDHHNACCGTDFWTVHVDRTEHASLLKTER